MKLKDYLEAHEPPMRVVDFAAKSGISYATVYSWLNGSRKPGPIYKKVVLEKTEGKVTNKDW